MKNRIVTVRNNMTHPQALTLLATNDQPAGKGIVLFSSFIIPSCSDSIHTDQTNLLVGVTATTFEPAQLIDIHLLESKVNISFDWLGNITIVWQPDHTFELLFYPLVIPPPSPKRW